MSDSSGLGSLIGSTSPESVSAPLSRNCGNEAPSLLEPIELCASDVKRHHGVEMSPNDIEGNSHRRAGSLDIGPGETQHFGSALDQFSFTDIQLII